MSSSEEKAPEGAETKENSEKKSDKFKAKMLYIGKDLQYWNTLSGRFEGSYPDIEFTFEDKFCESPECVKTLLHHVVQNSYRVIFIDYSLHSPQQLRLAQPF